MKAILFSTSYFLILFLPLTGWGQFVTITGYVSNAKNGNYLENVNIFESNSIIGTLTDKNGFYQLMLPPGTAEFSVTLDGFSDFSKQFVVMKDTVFSIRLKPVPNSKNGVKKKDETQASVSKNEGNLSKK